MSTQHRFDPERMAREWKAARWQAVAPYVDSSLQDQDEFAWIHAIAPQDRKPVLGALFEAGQEVGSRIRREVGEELTMDEVVQLINRHDSPCFHGNWKSAELGLAKEHCRTSCPFVKGAYDCDYWREAARGLVSALSDSVAFTRHESIGHQNTGCIDVLYSTPAVDAEYGPIPEEIMEAIEPLVNDFNRWQVTLELVGFNEGTLYIKLVGDHHPVCEPCHKTVISELRRALENVEPRPDVSELPSGTVLPGTGHTSGEHPNCQATSGASGLVRRLF